MRESASAMILPSRSAFTVSEGRDGVIDDSCNAIYEKLMNVSNADKESSESGAATRNGLKVEREIWAVIRINGGKIRKK